MDGVLISVNGTTRRASGDIVLTAGSTALAELADSISNRLETDPGASQHTILWKISRGAHSWEEGIDV